MAVQDGRVPRATTRVFGPDVVRIHGDALVLADPHIPYHDAEALEYAVGVAERHGIKTCILAGDTFEAAALSDFRRSVPDERGIAQELEEMADVLAVIAEKFDALIWLPGNHDRRLLHSAYGIGLNWAQIIRAMGLPEKTTATEYHYCEVISDGVRWHISHPDRFALNRAATIAAKRLCNVVMAHSHRIMMTRDVSGRYVIIETGGVFDPRRLPWIALTDDGRFVPVQGFTIIRSGRGHLYDLTAIREEARRKQWQLEQAQVQRQSTNS